MRKPSLLEGCTDWHVTTNLKHNFIFPTEIALTTKCPDIVIWSVKEKSSCYWVDPFEENFDWAHQRKLEKYEDLQEQCVKNGWIINVLPIEVGCRGFIANSTSIFLINFGLPPSDKRKYMEKIQDKALTASAWIWQSEWQQSDKVWWCHEILLGHSGLVVMMLRPGNHAWSQSHHLMKALLEAMLLYDTYIIWFAYLLITYELQSKWANLDETWLINSSFQGLFWNWYPRHQNLGEENYSERTHSTYSKLILVKLGL